MDDEARRLASIVPTGAVQADDGIKETGLETSGVFANILLTNLLAWGNTK